MAIGKTNIGGNSLYYSVVCSTTEPAKKEGRIWVKSSVKMTYFSFSNSPWSTAGVGNVVISGTPGGANPTSANDTIDVINTKVGGIGHRTKIDPTSCKQVQGSTGNWVSVDAYVCHSNTWVKFSSVFSATINITYPAGSTCTCKNGSTTLTAPNTSGTWACTVPNAGTWTVTSTSGTESDSKAVSVTTDGQSISVELSYATYLYNLGDTCDALTGGWQAIGKYNRPIDNGGTMGSPSAVNGAASLNISLYSSCGLVVTNNKVALNNYKTLTFKGSVTTLGTCNLRIYSYLTGDYMPSYSASAAIGTTGASVECSLDVSAITGSYYIGLALENANTIAMKQLYLED